MGQARQKHLSPLPTEIDATEEAQALLAPRCPVPATAGNITNELGKN